MKYIKKSVIGHINLDTYPIYVEDIYNGHEPFKIVGIRKNELELEGDYSGGTHDVIQKEWIDINKCFTIHTICEEELNPNGCQRHNLYCCGGGGIITKHIEYWK